MVTPLSGIYLQGLPVGCKAGLGQVRPIRTKHSKNIRKHEKHKKKHTPTAPTRQPEKNRILCIRDSFHGRTLATIFASNSKKMTEGFFPKVNGFDHFKFGNHKELEKKNNKKNCCNNG